MFQDDQIGAFLLIENHERGKPMDSEYVSIAEGTVYLKVERRGDQILAWYGTDGLQWVETKPIKISWPPRLKVGLARSIRRRSPCRSGSSNSRSASQLR